MLNNIDVRSNVDEAETSKTDVKPDSVVTSESNDVGINDLIGDETGSVITISDSGQSLQQGAIISIVFPLSTPAKKIGRFSHLKQGMSLPEWRHLVADS